MLFYWGRRVFVNFLDGSTCEGKLVFSWAIGMWKLKKPLFISGGEREEIEGFLLFSPKNVLMLQVVPDATSN